MDSEDSRLQTFSTWPLNAPVCFRQLSAGGFFATGNLLEVECNWCHCRISNWELYDDVDHRHILSNPLCEFITNRQQCGNVPLYPTLNLMMQQDVPRDGIENNPGTPTNSETKQQATLDLLDEKNRLATFKNWPNPNITPQSLAKAGFFYRNRSDEVECAWCKGVIAQWEKQDNAFEEHRRFFPECPRVLLGPLIEIAKDGIRDLGIQQISHPKNPKYTSIYARLRTYTNWPIPEIQRPEDLAQAGLYYQKVDDQVRCFHCNMGLRSWEKDDDPWFEHAKWYPMCEFVRLAKGVNYIQEVQELIKNVQTSEIQTQHMTIEEAMATEPVKLALEMGVENDTLRNKTQQQMLATGSPYTTVEDLLKAVFDEYTTTNVGSERITEISYGNNRTTSNTVAYDLVSTDEPRNDNNDRRVSNIQNVNDKQLSKATFELKQIDESTSRSDVKDNRVSLEEENRKLKDARLCKVCLDEEVGVVYLPCGHLVTCVQCAPGVHQCPMCRTTIQGFVRTYLS